MIGALAVRAVPIRPLRLCLAVVLAAGPARGHPVAGWVSCPVEAVRFVSASLSHAGEYAAHQHWANR